MGKSKLEYINDLANEILKDIVLITKNKSRNISEWHWGMFENIQFDINTVSNHSFFLIYKLNKPAECQLVFKTLTEKIKALKKLSSSATPDTKCQYIIFWHGDGLSFEGNS